MNKHVTIYDIAKTANVSSATVSKVFSNKGSISQETIKKVKMIAAQMGYHPNPAAQALKTNRTMQIMVSVPSIKDSFFISLIEELETEGRKYGYSILLNNTYDSFEEEVKTISRLRENFIDGLVMVSSDFTDEHFKLIKSCGKPVVLCGFGGISIGSEELVCDVICVNTRIGIYETTKHLIGQGYKDIAYVGDSLERETGKERYKGYEAAMIDSGLTVDKEKTFFGKPYDYFGYECGKAIAIMEKKPRAICAGTDDIVLGLMDAFEENGIRIPDDIAVIGMDNIEASRRCRPKMSTVNLSQREVGSLAGKFLFERLAGQGDAPRLVVREPQIIIRDSSISGKENGINGRQENNKPG